DSLHPIRPSNDPSTVTVRLPIAATHYLDKRLGLSSVQRNWVESQVVTGLHAQAGRINGISPTWFALMQTTIGALAEDGDELNARLTTASPAARAKINPPRGFDHQLTRELRSSMASKRFVRKIREYLEEECMPVWAFRTPSGMRNLGRRPIGQKNVQRIPQYSKRWSFSHTYFPSQQSHKTYEIRQNYWELEAARAALPKGFISG
ncbi:hypothetical protein RIE95_05070, partial [Acidithiobacillus thiooxidans]|uniref:hypothetical protein n=1 Tax=Acidithiobacillus thiooxidans TaxID=930 RepID=UPI00285A4143